MRTFRKPSLLMLAVRVVVITVLITLLAFAVALFLGIAGMALADLIRGGGVSMTRAYRDVALPAAAGVMIIAFNAVLVRELREYRRQRASTRTYSRVA